MFRRLAVLLLALLLAACNLSVPQATPTVAPTRTPSLTPEATGTVPPTAVAFVASPTFTTTPTETPTLTPTPTLTNTPPSTATKTLMPTVTPLPLIPTDTPTNAPPPTLTPTGTFTATPIPTATWTPSPTNTATLPPLPTLTPNPITTATRELSALEMTLMAERTAAVPTPAPTLDVTPTYITAEATIPPDNSLTLTPIQSETTPQEGLPTFTPPPQPTVALVVPLPPTLGAPPSMPTFIPMNPQTRAFALSTTGGNSSGTGFSLPHNNPILFARNPVDPNLYASTDTAGNLFLTGTMSYRPEMSPFSEFAPQSREENNAYVSTVAWSPDGQSLAFVINAKQASDNGVW
ncbi:MAG TPA: hypothetical protein VHO69_01555 [Phototrophicaceae bacterium]|nr:hypothetical protein [Phototrophicaceae bacterium]